MSASSRRPSSIAIARALALAPVGAMLAIGAVAYPSTGTDDSYITYWPAYALARYGAIVNVNGERVEQSSSLLWTLVLAAFTKLTRIDIEALGVPLSVLAGVATVWATGVLARHLEPRAEVAARWLIALSFPSLLWSFSGMETALAAALWTTFAASATPYLVHGAKRGALAASIGVLAAYLLVRPEAPFVVCAALAPIALLSFALSARRPALRVLGARASVLLAAASALTLVIGLFRHSYFGAWAPQPVHAKVSASAAGLLGRVLDGSLYALGFESVRGSTPPGWMDRIEVALFVSIGVLASAIAISRFVAGALFPDPSRQRELETGATVETAPTLPPDQGESAAHARAFVLAAFFLASLSFPVLVGGDWMGGWRFLCTPLPCAAVFVATLFTTFSRRLARGLVAVPIAFELFALLRTATVPALTIPLWFDLPGASRAEPFSVRRNVPHLRDAFFMPPMNAAVRRSLAARADGAPVSILSGQAGYIVYQLGKAFFGQVHFLDRVSLVTRDLQDCPLLSGVHTDLGFSIATVAPLFDPASPVHAACGLPVPDVLFDNGRRQLYALMLQSGRYDVVFEEGTAMLPPDFATSPSRTYQYLAVLTDPSRAALSPIPPQPLHPASPRHPLEP